MSKIAPEEFEKRVEMIRNKMKQAKLDALFVYGDEYRKENLRYVSNYWPIFERGGCIISMKGDPILLCAPECLEVAREMSVWQDIRVIQDFTCVTVPDTIEYAHTTYTTFAEILMELNSQSKVTRMGLVGYDAISHKVFLSVQNGFKQAELIESDNILTAIRLIKSEAEITMLKAACEQAALGVKKMMEVTAPGKTELEIAADGEEAARKAGAEANVFTLVDSGTRTNTIVGRPTEKMIEEGDMMMACLAVMYQGYTSTVEVPYVCGKPSPGQKKLLLALFEAEVGALDLLKAGTKQSDFVKKVKRRFAKDKFEKYDLYPPLHGIGLAEAESPYPNENIHESFRTNMTVNTDISLFGHPEGANRIEEGFVIREDGPEPLSDTARRLMQDELDKLRQ